MMMQNNGFHFFGIHFIWLFIWMVFLFLIFVTPYDISGERTKKESVRDILKKRLGSGQITTEEYLEQKRMLEV